MICFSLYVLQIFYLEHVFSLPLGGSTGKCSGPGFFPGSTTYWPGDLGQICCLCASVSASVQKGSGSVYLLVS